MNRVLLIATSFVLAFSSQAPAQEWARKMFEKEGTKFSHDFGTVAKDSKQEFSFDFQNIYKEDIHIASVSSTCGCTTPSVTKNLLKTRETASIVAKLNTDSYVGSKSATIRVTIDQPYYAEVQLSINSYIRDDVMFTPGVVNFGSAAAGEKAETSVNVQFSGSNSWKIVDVRSVNTNYEVELDEIQRSYGNVHYRMLVRLKSSTPVGYLQDQLVIVTNDSGMRNVTLPVEGRVVSPLTISPASLYLGVLKPGETVKKRLVVRGNKPFKILNVKCEDSHFQFDAPQEEAKALHFVPLQFQAGDDPGQVVEKIEIETDLASGLCAECTATATVKEAE